MIRHTAVSLLTSSIKHWSVKNGDSETYIKHLLLHNFGVHTTTVQVTHKTKKGGSVIYSFCSNKFPKTFTSFWSKNNVVIFSTGDEWSLKLFFFVLTARKANCLSLLVLADARKDHSSPLSVSKAHPNRGAYIILIWLQH